MRKAAREAEVDEVEDPDVYYEVSDSDDGGAKRRKPSGRGRARGRGRGKGRGRGRGRSEKVSEEVKQKIQSSPFLKRSKSALELKRKGGVEDLEEAAKKAKASEEKMVKEKKEKKVKQSLAAKFDEAAKEKEETKEPEDEKTTLATC